MRRIVYRLTLVFIFLIPWEGVIEFPGLGTAAKLTGLAVGVFWLASVVLSRRVRTPSPLLFATGLFVIWNALSVLWSPDPIESMRHVGTWVQSFGLVLILWDVYRTREAVLAGLQAYVLGAYVSIGGAIVNYAISNAYYSWYERYSPGEQTNPDGFGFIVALGIPVAAYLAGSPSPTRLGRLFRRANYLYIPAAFVGIALSGTRTAAIAAVLGLAFGLASLGRLGILTRVAVVAVLATALYVLMPVVQPLRSFERFGTTHAELTEGDLNGRLDQWRQGLVAFTEHPIIGVGSNMYRSVNTLGKLAHNSFISILTELGLVGFVLFGTIVAIAVAGALAHPKWERTFWLTVLLVWAIGSSTLTWEHRKTTWLFLPLVVVSAALVSGRERDPAADDVQIGAAAGAR